MRAPADQGFEVCRRDAKFVRNGRELAAIEAADFPDCLPVLEPISEQIDEPGDNRIWCGLACHDGLRRWSGVIVSLARDDRYCARSILVAAMIRSVRDAC